MLEEGLERAALPARALVAEDLERFGGLGPAHRVGHVADPVVALLLAHVAVELDHQLEILADGLLAESADLDRGIAPEAPERARYDQQRAHLAEPEPGHQERAQVFD